ncbi:cytochrome P450 [Streptomyces sp. MspMP-M5]|uniref:cytochrome P450 n=1 Tax=unclassified Streptomyces TaxID=2593676 RepID=UPI0003612BD5|nr:cytochrome P450 [Streptomyces sp. MspMP-M5]
MAGDKCPVGAVPGGAPLFPMRRPCPFGLPPAYAEMREHAPVRRARLAGGALVWLVSRHEDIRTLLGDARLSADRSRPGFPFLDSETAQLADVPVFLSMDAPDHLAYRHMFRSEFRPGQVDELRPFVQHCVDEHLDRMVTQGPPADLVTSLAMPVPALTAGRILGVPEGELPRLEELSVAALTHRDTKAYEELFNFVREIADDAAESPASAGMIGRVLREYVAAGQLDAWSMLATVFVILMAGYETTAHMISLGVLTLLHHPEQLAAVRRDPALVPQAVEELLRYLSVGELAAVRIAAEDIELHGTTIRAGEGVVLLGAAGNRDPRVFEDPERFDIHRSPARHLAFGHGPHACIGARVARLELAVVLTTLLERLPGLRLAQRITDDAVDYEAVLFGLKRLEVTW